MPSHLKAHIIYTGIVSFLLDQQTGDVQVVVPNGTMDSHHPHVSWLICDPLQEVYSTLTPVPVDEQLNAYYASGSMRLGGLKITEEPPELFLQKHNGVNYPEDLLVALRKGIGNNETAAFNKELLSSDPDRKISLRSRVTEGSLDVSLVDFSMVWRFEYEDDTQQQHLAQEVCNTVELEADALTVAFPYGSIRLGLAQAYPDYPILLMVGNTPLSDIFPDQKIYSSTELEVKDDHVKLYNKVSDKPTNPGQLPGLVGKKLTGAAIDFHDHKWPSEVEVRASGANCPPGWWDND